MLKSYFDYFTPSRKGGGKVMKYQQGNKIQLSHFDAQSGMYIGADGKPHSVAELVGSGWSASELSAMHMESTKNTTGAYTAGQKSMGAQLQTAMEVENSNARGTAANNFFSSLGMGINAKEQGIKDVLDEDGKVVGTKKVGASVGAQVATGVGAQVLQKGALAATSLTTDDKNFDSQSEAIDGLAHGTSQALMSSGNPWLMAAGAGIEALNAVDKMTGRNIQGFEVEGLSSSYGSLGRQESKAMRGIQGGWNKEKVQSALDRRNEQAQMALTAASISDDVQYEQEARMNSVQDTLLENQMALAGGMQTDVLSAKEGGKLVQKAQNGAKLKDVEVSEDENVLPTGAMHKNKNHLSELKEEITQKGIPVITVDDDSATTYEEIVEQKDSIVQHAEIESQEILFNKEVTNFLERAMKEWQESKDEDILLEVGKRITKEVLFNTKDQEGSIKQQMKAK